MVATSYTTGLLAFVLLISAALTVPTAELLLWLYRRSVHRGMTSAEHDEAGPPDSGATNMSGVARPAIRILDNRPARTSGMDEGDRFHAVEQSLRQAVLVYAVAGLAYGLLFGIGWSLQASGGLLVWRRVVWLTICYLWPTVLAIQIVAATSRGEQLALAAWYFALLAVFSLFALAVSPTLSAGQLAILWLATNVPPTLLMLGFLRRRVRAVGPLIVSFLSVGTLWFGLARTLWEVKREWLVSAGLDRMGILWAPIAAGLLLFAFAGWRLLRLFGELYRRKRIGDQSLMVDALYLFFATVQNFGLDPSGRIYLLTGPAAFLAYKAITWIGFRYLRARRQAIDTAAPVLLLLRAFSLGGRSERLFDALTKRWRRVGSIALIAGPDLVRTTVEPHEFLDFVGGKMSRRFVTGQADLASRISAFDREPDPDGRYRVNQFLCRPDTWQMTLRRLVQESSVVLMDLRSFSPRNQGCVYELRQVLSSTDLQRVVLVVDSTTDRRFLEDTLQQSWQQVPGDSPNCAVADLGVRLFFARDDSGPEVRLLLGELLARVTDR